MSLLSLLAVAFSTASHMQHRAVVGLPADPATVHLVLEHGSSQSIFAVFYVPKRTTTIFCSRHQVERTG